MKNFLLIAIDMMIAFITINYFSRPFKVNDKIMQALLETHLSQLRDIKFSNKCEILKQNLIDAKQLRLIFTPSTQTKMHNVWLKALQNQNTGNMVYIDHHDEYEMMMKFVYDLNLQTDIDLFSDQARHDCNVQITAIEKINAVQDMVLKQKLFYGYFKNYYTISFQPQFIY